MDESSGQSVVAFGATRATRTGHAGGSSRAGLALVELMLGLAVTALVGLGVAAMMTGVTHGTSSQTGRREAMLRGKALSNRLQAALRSSRMVLAHDADSLVLWTADSRTNGRPNLSELRLIEWGAEDHTLRSYTASFPASWSAEQRRDHDTSYSLDEDFHQVVEDLKDGDHFPPTRWATGVRGWQTTPAPSDPREAELVTYRLTLTRDDVTRAVVGEAALRNR